MKKLTTLLFFFPLFVYAQNARMSANMQLYLQQPSACTQKVLYKTAQQNYISTFLKVQQPFNEQPLLKLGVSIGTRAGNVYTALIPEQVVQQVLQIEGIEYVQLDEPIFASLESARKAARVDSVHQAILLNMPYTGKGVVVGIIDAGFDYSHPTFYDTTGSVLRIKRVWEQRQTGNPPAGFNYGNELTDTVAMLAKGYDVNTFSHGTHVGGIAAGSGFGSTGNMRGVAYESELVFVGIRPEKSEWTGMGMASIIDAVNYIFTYAQSVGKPAVANLSWGCSIGPNDGTSLFATALNNITGGGRIFVNSAGNNGDENIHLYKAFTTTDTALYSIATLPVVNSQKRSWLDTWGNAGKSFAVSLQLYNGAQRSTDSLVFLLSQTAIDTFLIGSDGDTLFIKAYGTPADLNGKPHVLLDVFNKSTNRILFGIHSKAAKVHSWMGFVDAYNGYYGAFEQGGLAKAVDGNNQYTLGEMSCTQSAVTVAALVSKISFRNLAGGQISYSGYAGTGFLAPFSSKGPTVDGRIKPNIAAPGMTIASAVNSYDQSYAPGGGNYQMSVLKFVSPKNNRNYYYAEASGTSMSAPMASGIVALMLQANPSLEPGRVQQILAQTATKDTRTGINPDSSRWGAGKINAYAALKQSLLSVGVCKEPLVEEQSIILYPNPTSQYMQLNYSLRKACPVLIRLFDIAGREVSSSIHLGEIGANTTRMDLQNLKSGLYWVQVNEGKSIKLVVK
ncbi:MAG: S8 family serine peptidase [Bacteroidota bacterium]|jgi:subtilisin family serine protease